MRLLERVKAELYARRMTKKTILARGVGADYSALWLRGLEGLAVADRVTDPLAQVAGIYICVSRIVDSLTSVTWSLYDGERDLDDHPFYDLIAKPNPALVGTALLAITETWIQMRGRAFWLLDAFAQGTPRRIRVLEPDRMTPEIKGGELTGWKYQATSGTYALSIEEVVRFAKPDHRNPYGGLAPLEAARQGYNLSWKSAKFQEQFYQNGSVPPYYVKFPPERVPTPQQKEQMREEFRRQYSGLANAGSPVFTFHGAELASVSVNQREAEWLATQNLTMKQIAAVFGVPYSVAGFVEDANRSISTEDKRTFWGGKIRSEAELLSSVIQTAVLDPYYDGVEFKWDFQAKFSEVMAEEMRAQAQAAASLMSWGVPPEDAFRIFGIPVDTRGRPWLREGWLPFSLQRASLLMEDEPPLSPAPAPAPDEEPDAEDPEEPSEPADEEQGDPAEKGKGKTVRRSYWTSNEKARAVLWRRHVATAEKVERRYLGDWRKFLRWLGAEISRRAAGSRATSGELRALDDLLVSKMADAFPSNDEVGRKAVEFTKESRMMAIKYGWETAAQDMNISLDWNALDPRVLKAYSERIIFVKTAAIAEQDRVKAKVREGIENGDSIDAIEETVREHLLASSQGMARTVARTETMSSFSRARVDAFADSGITRHEWLSARDDDVRESHKPGPAGVDGEIRVIGEEFSNGLAWPLQWDGPASEVINCRCVTLPVVGGD